MTVLFRARNGVLVEVHSRMVLDTDMRPSLGQLWDFVLFFMAELLRLERHTRFTS